MEKQIPKHISAFNEGDLITRIAPTQIYHKQLNDNLGMEMDLLAYQDNSGIGSPFKFLGVANGTIYLEHAKGHFKGSKTDYFKVHSHSDGWVKYIDPKTIEEPKKRSLNKKNIENMLDSLNLN